jgi:CHRD domain
MHFSSPRLAVAMLAATGSIILACADNVTSTSPADETVSEAVPTPLETMSSHLRKGVRLRADLSGAEEVPPADDDGRGKAHVVVGVEQGEVCFDVRFRRITTGNRGHIHSGAAGINGPIVVPFFDLHLPASQRDPRLDDLEKDDELDGCITGLSPTLLADIVANPANYYVNVHNSRFPGGAVRAQLER